MFEVGKVNKRTGSYLVFALVGCSFLAVPIVNIAPVKFVWNASASVPKGLYHVTNRTPEKGDLALVQLPIWAAFLANWRGYLPRNTPAIKRISAVRGDVVCRCGKKLFVNQKLVAIAKIADQTGRKLPRWNGCKLLQAGEVFLLADHSYSFDGRYFGITKFTEIIGTVAPVWLAAD